MVFFTINFSLFSFPLCKVLFFLTPWVYFLSYTLCIYIFFPLCVYSFFPLLVYIFFATVYILFPTPWWIISCSLGVYSVPIFYACGPYRCVSFLFPLRIFLFSFSFLFFVILSTLLLSISLLVSNTCYFFPFHLPHFVNFHLPLTSYFSSFIFVSYLHAVTCLLMSLRSSRLTSPSFLLTYLLQHHTSCLPTCVSCSPGCRIMRVTWGSQGKGTDGPNIRAQVHLLTLRTC